MPWNPVGVLECLASSQRKVIKDIHNNRIELTNQLRMAGWKKMKSLLERLARDEKKLHSEMKEQLRMDERKPVMDVRLALFARVDTAPLPDSAAAVLRL